MSENKSSGSKGGAQKGPSEAALDTKPATPEAKAKKGKEEATEGPSLVTLVVAEGRSVTSLRGILGEGAVVSSRDFFHGDNDISVLIQGGVLHEVK